MNFDNVTTEQLEATDNRLTKDRSALYAWSNRDLSVKNRNRLTAAIREEQDAILTELMKREGINA